LFGKDPGNDLGVELLPLSLEELDVPERAAAEIYARP
jgi:hypothetical protein